MTDDIKALISESRALLHQTKNPGKFIPPRPVGYPNMAWYLPVGFYRATTREFQKEVIDVNIYKPRERPSWIPEEVRVIMHSHRPALSCRPELMCHEYGYEPPEYLEKEFNQKWGYLYNPTFKKGSISFGFE